MQYPSPVAESALVTMVTFLFSTMAVSGLPDNLVGYFASDRLQSRFDVIR